MLVRDCDATMPCFSKLNFKVDTLQVSEKSAIDMISRDECSYTSCYCEENVLLLTQKLAALPGEARVAFISNPNKAVPVWDQRAAAPGEPVVWDYHVVALHRAPESGWSVYDFDSLLPWPCPAAAYVSAAFHPGRVRPEYSQWLRILSASDCISRFSSDRRHMLAADGSGKYLKPPPPHAPLCGATARSAHELGAFLDFSLATKQSSGKGVGLGRRPIAAPLMPDPWYGQLLSVAEFEAQYCT
jgi:protein N-terminal glutamine amidohydrolase